MKMKVGNGQAEFHHDGAIRVRRRQNRTLGTVQKRTETGELIRRELRGVFDVARADDHDVSGDRPVAVKNDVSVLALQDHMVLGPEFSATKGAWLHGGMIRPLAERR